MRKTLLLLCLPLLLWNCTDVVELDLPEQEPLLVVNSLFTPDSAWTVDVSASQNALSTEPYEQVQHATVAVYQGNKLLFNMDHAGNGKYKAADVLPQAMEHYTLKVTAPGFPACEATGFAPALPAISSLRVTRASAPKDPNMPEAEVTFILTDAPNVQNYYYISAYFPDTAHTGEAYKFYLNLDMQAPFEEEFTMGALYFFSDKLIDGKATTLKLRYELPQKGTPLYLNIAQISPDYYLYAQTLARYSVDNFMTTPGPVHNNIKNGLGIFAGYNTTTYLIQY